MTDPDAKVLELTLRIGARPQTVWRYWTDPNRMCDWWGTAAELDPRPGGTCRIDMGEGPTMRGEYVELVPYERIVFTFGWDPTDDAPAIAPGSTLVEVTLAPDGADTILTLRHHDIPAAQADEHRSGWSHFLPILADVASAHEYEQEERR